MVLVWNELAGGDNEYCAAIVALNALLTIVLYPPFSLFYLLTLPKAIFGTSGPSLLSALRNRNASNRNASRNRPSSPGPQPQTPCLPPSPPCPHSPLSLSSPLCAGGGALVDVTVSQIAVSVGIYLGVPLAAAVLTWAAFTKTKGTEWYVYLYIYIEWILYVQQPSHPPRALSGTPKRPPPSRQCLEALDMSSSSSLPSDFTPALTHPNPSPP
jgi:ACR3 family arsenite efflux pump ArsB